METITIKLIENTIFICWEGLLTPKMYAEITAKIEALERQHNRLFNRFADLRRAYFKEFCYKDMEPLTWQRKSMLDQYVDQQIKLAIVATNPTVYGMLRMYGTLMEMQYLEVEVFEDPVMAARWLGFDEYPPAGADWPS